MNRLLVVVARWCLFAVFPCSISAHHAFDAEFSRDLPLTLEGPVTRVEWANPHARIYVDVLNPETGELVNWNLELMSPNMYIRQGWNKDTLQPGDKVIITGWRARNDPAVGNVGTIKKEDGTELFTRRR